MNGELRGSPACLALDDHAMGGRLPSPCSNSGRKARSSERLRSRSRSIVGNVTPDCTEKASDRARTVDAIVPSRSRILTSKVVSTEGRRAARNGLTESTAART
jgi:hypothetical protein